MSARFKAPRGTFDVLPAESAARMRVFAAASGIFERAGYGRIETPVFEETELFERGVGESTDIVQKEMFSFDRPGWALAHPQAGGHRADLPGLRRARHAQAPAAGEAVVLGPVLPPRAAAGRPLPPVPPARPRGDRDRLTAGRRRGDHLARRAVPRAGAPRPAPAARQPRLARRACRVPRRASRPSAGQRSGAGRRGSRPDRRQPAACVRLGPRGHARGDGERADDARPPR